MHVEEDALDPLEKEMLRKRRIRVDEKRDVEGESQSGASTNGDEQDYVDNGKLNADGKSPCWNWSNDGWCRFEAGCKFSHQEDQRGSTKGNRIGDPFVKGAARRPKGKGKGKGKRKGKE